MIIGPLIEMGYGHCMLFAWNNRSREGSQHCKRRRVVGDIQVCYLQEASIRSHKIDACQCHLAQVLYLVASLWRMLRSCVEFFDVMFSPRKLAACKLDAEESIFPAKDRSWLCEQ